MQQVLCSGTGKATMVTPGWLCEDNLKARSPSDVSSMRVQRSDSLTLEHAVVSFRLDLSDLLFPLHRINLFPRRGYVDISTCMEPPLSASKSKKSRF
jgi:hypothetical protein